jgi:tetratricopeptide (TPR) repeat protein
VQLLLTVLVAALAAFGAGRLALSRAATEPAPANGRAELTSAVADLRAEVARLEQELAQRESRLAAPAPIAEGLDEIDIAAAVARWRAAHPEIEASSAPAEAEATAVASSVLDVASLPLDELVRALSGNRFDDQRQQELFQALREAGRMDEYVAHMEALAAADPNNAELQVALGHAYLQKLFGLGNSPEVGDVAMKSDRAFDRALALDDSNWNARFSKAVSLSNWPAFLGRGPEAIEHFEILIEQQEGQALRPEFAMPYLFLGNMHQAAGKREQALVAWQAGLALFPDSEDLRGAIELAEGR